MASVPSTSTPLSTSLPALPASAINMTPEVVRNRGDALRERPIETSNRWFFNKEDIEKTPSRKGGYDSDKELNYRQQAANFIQDMGQRLQV